jgi:hypothetical protein
MLLSAYARVCRRGRALASAFGPVVARFIRPCGRKQRTLIPCDFTLPLPQPAFGTSMTASRSTEAVCLMKRTSGPRLSLHLCLDHCSVLGKQESGSTAKDCSSSVAILVPLGRVVPLFPPTSLPGCDPPEIPDRIRTTEPRLLGRPRRDAFPTQSNAEVQTPEQAWNREPPSPQG